MFITFTEWIEVGRFLWVCQGCSRECRVTSTVAPKPQVECDHMPEQIEKILAPYGGQIRGGD